MTAPNIKSIRILLVEDNPGDVRLTQEALKAGKISNELSIVVDGEAALSYLRKEGEYTSVKRPDLVLLDVVMPQMSGMDTLKEMRSFDSKTKIVICTGAGDVEMEKEALNPRGAVSRYPSQR